MDVRVWFDNLELWARDARCPRPVAQHEHHGRFHSKEKAADPLAHAPLEDPDTFEDLQLVGCKCRAQGLKCKDGHCPCVQARQVCTAATCGVSALD